MKFQFRLERVLDFYRLRETLMKMELSRAVAALQQLQHQITKYADQLQYLLAQAPKQLADGGDWTPYGVGQVQIVVSAMKGLETAVEKCQAEVEEKKYALGKLSMRREALEKLREKRRGEFRLGESRKEQKFLDEVHLRSKWK